ncbi:MAG: GntR family transcriptional regulator [Inquilinus sp.]|uniref:GntR family transcriptional regulator n=1 Tax=Bacteria TaxID=2 RepID=UPI00110FD58E|nr:GntR family transcriptional regulator [Mycobacterium sp. KBS0706]TSD86121.1 GntR family transcriptional regulator [Mycobacterium sp. KBS0706]
MSWMLHDLDDGPAPLWAQIADRLRADIKKGAFRPGDLLPAESELNRRFGVSRTTSRAALDCLESEGLIVRKSGRGSMVLPPRIERPLNRLSSFSEDMQARGLRAGYRTRSIRRCPVEAAVAAELQIEPGSIVIEIDRLLLADDKPIATSMTYLAPFAFENGLFPDCAELDSGSLYQWLQDKAGIRLATGSERIEAMIADAPTAQSLGLRSPAAVLVSHRISRTAAGRPVEYAVLHYRADRYNFRVESARP